MLFPHERAAGHGIGKRRPAEAPVARAAAGAGAPGISRRPVLDEPGGGANPAHPGPEHAAARDQRHAYFFFAFFSAGAGLMGHWSEGERACLR